MFSPRRITSTFLALGLGGFALHAAPADTATPAATTTPASPPSAVPATFKIGNPLPEGPGLEWPRSDGQPGKLVLRFGENKWNLYFLDYQGKLIAPASAAGTLYTEEIIVRKNINYPLSPAPDGLSLTSPLLVKPNVKQFAVRLVLRDTGNRDKIENYPRTTFSR